MHLKEKVAKQKKKNMVSVHITSDTYIPIRTYIRKIQSYLESKFDFNLSSNVLVLLHCFIDLS